MPINTKINTGGLADGAVRTAKIAGDAVTNAKGADDAVGIEHLSDASNVGDKYHKVPVYADDSARNTGVGGSPAVGMLIYNTAKGVIQQYNAQGWTSIDSPPTITSLDYPGDATALNPVGDETLVITGTNFQSGLTVTIDGTAPTSFTRNSSTQITVTGTPAKSAATYADGLKVTNTTGLAAGINVIYDALPTWTTAAGSLGSFVDGSYTNSSTRTISIVAAEGSDAITYAQVSDETGNTVITSGVAGLTLGTSGANAGYLTGTLSGTEGTTYNFYAKPTDAEGQIGAVRLFNIISAHAASGGTTATYTYSSTDYKAHKFITNGSDDWTVGTDQDFVVAASLACDIILVAGGGAGSCAANNYGGAGGGAGGILYVPAITLGVGTYTIRVGEGGIENSTSADTGDAGGHSTLTGASPATVGVLTAKGGGGGRGTSSSSVSSDGGSGGGHTRDADGGDQQNGTETFASYSGTLANNNNDGGDAPSSGSVCGGGGGAGSAGGADREAGAAAKSIITDEATTQALLDAVSAGHDVSGTRWLASGGGGGGNEMTSWPYGVINGGGGSGGYGAEGSVNRKGGTASAGTGSGGGGMGRFNGQNNTSHAYSRGGAGGSGLVIIRYAV